MPHKLNCPPVGCWRQEAATSLRRTTEAKAPTRVARPSPCVLSTATLGSAIPLCTTIRMLVPVREFFALGQFAVRKNVSFG